MTLTFPLDPLYDRLRSRPRIDPERIMASSASPLLLAMHLDDEIEPFDHIRLTDTYLVALRNLSLYMDGPGPLSWVYAQGADGPFQYLGEGLAAATTPKAFKAHELLMVRPLAGGEPPEFLLLPPGHEDRAVTRLHVSEPPRSGKSVLITENTPLWYLLHHPAGAVTLATYSATFAEKWGASAGARMPEILPFLPVATDGAPLEPITSNQENLSFRKGKDRGEINYRGVGGALTGTGWTLGLIDDPFKDAKDAMSQAERDAKKAWYTAVFTSRRMRRRGCPPPLEIQVATRWSEDDLAGNFVFGEDGEARPGWCALNLPALSEGDGDPLGRPKGAALCPQLRSKSDWEAERDQDPVWFEAINQGRPAHQDGNLFRKTLDGNYWRYRSTGDEIIGPHNKRLKVDEMRWFITVDLAATKRQTSDWSVATEWGYHPTQRVLVRGRASRERVSTETHRDWLDAFVAAGVRKYLMVGIEHKTFGISLVNELRARNPAYVVAPIKVEADKVTRALPYAEGVKSGRVWFPAEPTDFTWEAEHVMFPNGRFDDQVDTGSMAWAYCISIPATPVAPPADVTPAHDQRRRRLAARGGKPMHDFDRLALLMKQTLPPEDSGPWNSDS